ncbi:hypothetical protein AN639_01295 [Candidatus Epulonipiscium fishelsonii]|uniref:Uncharacterized protein n=1 Tax=Candidatus Epulonipiscium fishelsonii TaxID=77094 RepID=A0ACC8XC08_9FIRM|nr:hypothetical protein AN639_01295 [Epulopiscium sp. SCG-B05WGA-EpuloA1]ONI40035.1 hypothetical protein AN396_06710 [Epulopiscium sp. SCG-B11WGA-EpuloA1]
MNLTDKPRLFGIEFSNRNFNSNEIQNIILCGGQNLLSPERRFDAIISNSPDLFDCEVQN